MLSNSIAIDCLVLNIPKQVFYGEKKGEEKDLAKTIKGIKQESGIKSTKEMISVTYHTKCMWIILNMEVTFKSIHSVGWPDSLVQETK